jgi:hypothetical protein
MVKKAIAIALASNGKKYKHKINVHSLQSLSFAGFTIALAARNKNLSICASKTSVREFWSQRCRQLTLRVSFLFPASNT